MKFTLPPIVIATERLLVQIEKTVSKYPKSYRYELGRELRVGAVSAVLLARDAFRSSRDRVRQDAIVDQLSTAIDGIKVRLQLSQQLQCMSFARFEELARSVSGIGKQCGAWRKQIKERLTGQSPAAKCQQKSPQILSTGVASQEANV